MTSKPTPELPAARAHLLIQGRVQGVGFRYSAQLIANHIGVCGWARNQPDGTVEAIAEGTRQQVENFIRWCHLGPQAAEVREVRVDWENSTGEFSDFRTLR